MWVLIEKTNLNNINIFGPYEDKYDAMVHMDKKVMGYKRACDFVVRFIQDGDDKWVLENPNKFPYQVNEFIVEFCIQELQKFE
jgi:hypothetical protein